MSSTAPTLDLTRTDITRDEYITAMTALTEHMNVLYDAYGWCNERHRYFAAVLPEYYNASGHSELHVAMVPEETDFAARLRRVRARILWYMRACTINMTDGNAGLRAAGLPEFTVKPLTGRRYRVWFAYADVSITEESSANFQRFYDNFQAYIAARLDGTEYTGPDIGYVPGSIVFQTDHLSDYRIIRRVDTAGAIPVSETEHPGTVD